MLLVIILYTYSECIGKNFICYLPLYIDVFSTALFYLAAHNAKVALIFLVVFFPKPVKFNI